MAAPDVSETVLKGLDAKHMGEFLPMCIYPRQESFQ